MQERKHDDRHGHDHRADFFDVLPGALDGAAHDSFKGGQVIVRQLHDKGRGFVPGKHRMRQQLGDQQRENDGHRRNVEGHQAAVVGEESAHQQGIERHFGQTVHERDGKDGGHACARIGNRLGRHDARYGTAAGEDAAEDQRQRALPVHAEAVQHLVKDESDARHVARVFKDGNGSEEDQEDRYVVQERIGRVDQPQGQRTRIGINEKTGVGQESGDPFAGVGEVGPDVARQFVAPDDGDLIDHEHRQQQEKWRGPAVEQEVINTVGNRWLVRIAAEQDPVEQADDALVATGDHMVADFQLETMFKTLAQDFHFGQQGVRGRQFLPDLCHGLFVVFQQLQCQPAGRGQCCRAFLRQLGAQLVDERVESAIIHRVGVLPGEPGRVVCPGTNGLTQAFAAATGTTDSRHHRD